MNWFLNPLPRHRSSQREWSFLCFSWKWNGLFHENIFKAIRLYDSFRDKTPPAIVFVISLHTPAFALSRLHFPSKRCHNILHNLAVLFFLRFTPLSFGSHAYIRGDIREIILVYLIVQVSGKILPCGHQGRKRDEARKQYLGIIWRTANSFQGS